MSLSTRKLKEDELESAVIALKKGNKSAFQALYGHYGQIIYRFCLRMLGDKSAAQDALQETFIKVFENASTLRNNNLSSWLFVIARRSCINYIRNNKRHDLFIEELFVSTSQDLDFVMKQHISQALQTLPISLREALILREFEGYSYQEIAEIIGIDISLAKVRVHRARIAMRKILAPIAQEWYES